MRLRIGGAITRIDALVAARYHFARETGRRGSNDVLATQRLKGGGRMTNRAALWTLAIVVACLPAWSPGVGAATKTAGPTGAPILSLAPQPDGSILAGSYEALCRHAAAAAEWECLPLTDWKIELVHASTRGPILAHVSTTGDVHVSKDLVSHAGGSSWQALIASRSPIDCCRQDAGATRRR